MDKKEAWPWIKKDDKEIILMLVGEININRTKPEEAFANVMDALLSADVLFGHLECPLTTPSKDPNIPDIPYKPKWEFSEPSMVKAWSAARFAAVSCASNVMFGQRAVKDTIKTLNAAGIAHCGIGLNNEEAREPAVVERKGVKFGFLSYTSIFWPAFLPAGPKTPGVATIKAHTSYQPGKRVAEMPGAPPIIRTFPDDKDLQAMEDDIRKLRKKVDIVVASYHWGVSSSNHTFEYQQAYAHVAINSGVDIVMGHGSHVPQEIEVYKGKPIFYSLGNFAFDWHHMRNRNLEGILVSCGVKNKKLSRVSFVPAKRNEDNLITILPPTDKEGTKIIDDIVLMSSKHNTNFIKNDLEVILEDIR